MKVNILIRKKNLPSPPLKIKWLSP